MIMKNLLTLTLLCASFLLFNGCQSAATSESTESEDTKVGATPEAQPEAEKEVTVNIPVTGDAYSITTIKDGIPSPKKEMKGNIGGAEIKITYGSPSLRGRSIGKELASFGKLWRTGANEASSFEVSQDVTINGETLKAGKYGLFTIPDAENWTVILNSDWDMWGAGNYDESKDVLRLEIPAKMVEEKVEMMDFMIDGNAVIFRWGNHALNIEMA